VDPFVIGKTRDGPGDISLGFQVVVHVLDVDHNRISRLWTGRQGYFSYTGAGGGKACQKGGVEPGEPRREVPDNAEG
jgi:hypothetical protein